MTYTEADSLMSGSDSDTVQLLCVQKSTVRVKQAQNLSAQADNTDWQCNLAFILMRI